MTDDLTARGQDLAQNAQEGVNAYLKLGQGKINEASNTYSQAIDPLFSRFSSPFFM
ncbi:hypothetical protein M408DRAFT_246137 [Serendipita vermifera MAFF 305830]|uniref:Uncharacterized protein n=1 Tax=Serendipita vermifera MAFF 305830 TaxID=933852 RepID=A0A0C2X445_SERVB|nr:hypothetical protein M408DRAFT_246137 [Serendipita vermifera MAFF 305830]